MLNKKSICLKVLCGFVLGLIWCFCIATNMSYPPVGGLLLMGSIAGFVMGVASIPFKFTKVMVLIFAGFLATVFLLLLDLLPDIRKSGLVGYILLPTYALFFSLSLGIVDKSFSKFIAGTICGFIASVVSIILFIIATLLTFGFGWARPYPWLGDWPMYIASIIIGILLIVGIEIKECFIGNVNKGMSCE